MSSTVEREEARVAFLERAGLSDAERQSLPGDASTRRYERLIRPNGATLMLMDAPRSNESPPCDPSWDEATRAASGWNAMNRLSASRVEAFAAVAAHLRGLGLSAPEVVAIDAPLGFAVTEDLGDGVFARLLEEGADERELYFAAIDVIVRLQESEPPKVLEGAGGAWPVLDYDAFALKSAVDLFVQWWPKLKPAARIDEAAVAEWEALWAPVCRSAAERATVLCHRDYHAENLIWLPARAGVARMGLIDFQDALRAHPSWDVHHLLQDARRDVPAELEQAALERYFALRGAKVDREAFLADYAALATLNQARILGIFARLIVRDGKPRYAAFLPRLWRLVGQNLAAPEMAPLKRWFDTHVPVEARA